KPIHHLDGGRHDAAADDRRYGPASLVYRSKAGEQRHDGLRTPQQAEGGLGHDRQSAFRSNEHAEEIVTGRIERLAADVDELAIRQDCFHSEHVMDREPVLQTVSAAGILRDVAADRADDLARGIRCVITPEWGDSTRDLEVRDSWLDCRAQVWYVDVEHAVQFGKRNENTARHWQCAA